MAATMTQAPSVPSSSNAHQRLGGHVNEIIIVTLILAISVALLCYRGLFQLELGGLDEAHNIMDGIFFHDLYTDWPFTSIVQYTYDYYKQYPALGFLFWPPFFPAVEGIIFKLFGISLTSAQLTIYLFTLILAVTFYWLARTRMAAAPALCGTLILITTPGLYPYMNTTMREVPTIAMMTLVLLIYLRISRATAMPAKILPWQSLALMASLALYTKQPAFIMFPGILADLLVNRRHLLTQQAVWLSALTFTLLTLPLVIFTLKFGHANIQQSVGTGTSLIMSHYEGLQRWSMDSWLYYPQALPEIFSPVLLALLAISGFFCIRSPRFAAENILLITWIIGFYLIFSYFDNKYVRFTLLVCVPITLLAMNGTLHMLHELPKVSTRLALIFLAVVAASGWQLQGLKIQTMRGTSAISESVDLAHLDGNIAYWGKFRQAFVYHFRQADEDRKHFILQADDLFTKADNLEAMLKSYRIRIILIETDNLSDQEKNIASALTSLPDIKHLSTGEFWSGFNHNNISLYKYDGALAEKMAPIELSSTLIKSD